MKNNPAYTSTIAFRKAAIKHIVPIPEVWKPDYWITTLAALHRGLGVIDQPLMQYRQHSTNRGESIKRTLPEQWRKAKTNNTKAYRRQLNQVLELIAQCDKVPPMQDASEIHSTLAGKREHLQARLGLSGCNTVQKLRTILKELAKGRYQRYSLGMRSACKDLIF